MGGRPAVSLLPDLAGADWLHSPAVTRIFTLLNDRGEEARIVGGAVRNALLGLPLGDLDFATTATPDLVMAAAAAAGIKTVPTGIDHGTVTLIVAGAAYEVTTLREDIATDGRHAVVRFGRDWSADAMRRDFTVNALSVDSAGRLHDPVGGYDDIRARRIRFIGDAERRIAEDRLRILRFFRLHAAYGAGAPDPDSLAAAIRARHGLRRLSAERIGQEMRRLLEAPGAGDVVVVMQESGILGIVLAGVGYLGPFNRMLSLDEAVPAGGSVALRLAALGCRVDEDVARLTGRLRLSNAERNRMAAAVAAAVAVTPELDQRALRRMLYRLGAAAYGDAVALAFAWKGGSDGRAWRDPFRLPGQWNPPRFPLRGRDILMAGAAHGQEVGVILRTLEDWWIENDFRPVEAELRARLQTMIAAPRQDLD